MVFQERSRERKRTMNHAIGDIFVADRFGEVGR